MPGMGWQSEHFDIFLWHASSEDRESGNFLVGEGVFAHDFDALVNDSRQVLPILDDLILKRHQQLALTLGSLIVSAFVLSKADVTHRVIAAQGFDPRLKVNVKISRVVVVIHLVFDRDGNTADVGDQLLESDVIENDCAVDFDAGQILDGFLLLLICNLRLGKVVISVELVSRFAGQLGACIARDGNSGDRFIFEVEVSQKDHVGSPRFFENLLSAWREVFITTEKENIDRVFLELCARLDIKDETLDHRLHHFAF